MTKHPSPSLIIAPFSNSDIRDWPAPHFAKLIAKLRSLLSPDSLFRVVGTASQRLRAHEIVREFHPSQVSNDCGRYSWDEVTDQIRSAACVVGNNSGITHLAAYSGVPTVCVFGGSHQRLEWHPSGPWVVVVSRAIACSPCHLDHNAGCPYDKACLREVDPAVVAASVVAVMNRAEKLPNT